MDVLIVDNKAVELFPDGAPELHKDLFVLRDYKGEVGMNWDWDGEKFTLFVPFSKTEEGVRNTRNALMAETDWMTLPDNNPTEELLAYRQALRDITEQEGFPENVVWPEKPF